MSYLPDWPPASTSISGPIYGKPSKAGHCIVGFSPSGAQYLRHRLFFESVRQNRRERVLPLSLLRLLDAGAARASVAQVFPYQNLTPGDGIKARVTNVILDLYVCLGRQIGECVIYYNDKNAPPAWPAPRHAASLACPDADDTVAAPFYHVSVPNLYTFYNGGRLALLGAGDSGAAIPLAGLHFVVHLDDVLARRAYDTAGVEGHARDRVVVGISIVDGACS